MVEPGSGSLGIVTGSVLGIGISMRAAAWPFAEAVMHTWCLSRISHVICYHSAGYFQSCAVFRGSTILGCAFGAASSLAKPMKALPRLLVEHRSNSCACMSLRD